MISDAKRRATARYKSNVKRITIDFPPSEKDLWQHLQNQPKKQTYIKDLIRADIKGNTK